MEEATPASAALLAQTRASVGSYGATSPSSNIQDSMSWAGASPECAALRYQDRAAAGSCWPPTPRNRAVAKLRWPDGSPPSAATFSQAAARAGSGSTPKPSRKQAPTLLAALATPRWASGPHIASAALYSPALANVSASASCASTDASAGRVRWNKKRSDATGSGPEQEQIHSGPPVAGFQHQQIQSEAGHIVGDRFQRRILVLRHDFHETPALVAAFGLDRIGEALDRLIVD